MSDELPDFRDEYGQERRCGSLTPPSDLVCSFPPFALSEEEPLWTPAQIRAAVRDPNRKPSRVAFGPDWILNQGSHGSCNGFAEAGAFARARWSSGYRDKKKFSGAYAYSLMNNNRDAGSVLEHGMRNLMSKGIAEERFANANQIYRSQYDTKAADANAALHKGLQCYRALTKEAWDTALATGLYYGVAALSAGKKYQTPNQYGIVGADAGSGNHAVCVDGICEVSGTMVYDSPGSWGLSLGGQGLGRVYCTWDSFDDCFKAHWFYLIPFVQEGQQ